MFPQMLDTYLHLPGGQEVRLQRSHQGQRIMQRCTVNHIIGVTVKFKIVLQRPVHKFNDRLIVFPAIPFQQLQMLRGDQRLQRHIQTDHQHGQS
ncbi:hypothetical protein D3C87_1588900 [compost metagenome]